MTSTAPAASWTPEDLHWLADQRELEIAAPSSSGDHRSWTPIWVVVAGGAVFVRTWQRRGTGWYGRAVATAHAWILVSGDRVEVSVEVAGTAQADEVDAAYRAKYGTGAAQSMITAEAAASTLRLSRAT